MKINHLILNLILAVLFIGGSTFAETVKDPGTDGEFTPRGQGQLEFVPRGQRQQEFIPRGQGQQEFIPRGQGQQEFIPRGHRQQEFVPRGQGQYVFEPRHQSQGYQVNAETDFPYEGYPLADTDEEDM